MSDDLPTHFNENQESIHIPQAPKTSVIRKVFFNALGFFVGYYLGAFALQISKWFLFDILGSVKIITSILSWPVDYGTYALSIVIFVDAAVTLYTCSFISKFGRAKYNYSCLILGLIRIIHYISSTIQTIKTDGFDFDIVWVIAIMLIAFLSLSISTTKNEEL